MPESVGSRSAAVKDNFAPRLSGPADERHPLTMAHRPWEAMRAFWAVKPRLRVLAWMTGLNRSSAYRLLQRFGDRGSGRKSDLHRLCEQVEYAARVARDREMEAARAMAELPLRVFEAALAKRRADEGLCGVGDARLFDELTDVIRARSHRRPWEEQRREKFEAVDALMQEIAAGDRRELFSAERPLLSVH